MGDFLVRCSKRPKLKSENDDDDCYVKLPPAHVSELILQKLTPFSQEYFRFGGVCTQWFSILMDDRARRRLTHHQRPPLLLVPTIQCNNQKGFISRLYSITLNAFMEGLYVKVNCNDLVHFCGSSYGWLSYVIKSYHIVLHNPFLSKSILLPAIMRDFDTPPSYDNLQLYSFYEDFHFQTDYLGLQYSVCKIILSSLDDFLVVAVYGGLGRLAFFKPCSNPSFKFPSWTYLEVQEGDTMPFGFDDVIFHKGLVYAINGFMHYVAVIKVRVLFDSKSNGSSPVMIEAFDKIVAPYVEEGLKSVCWYLTETSNKEGLLLIARLVHTIYLGRHSTKKLYVFKLTKMDDSESMQWVKVSNLDGDVVFIGHNHSMSVSAASAGCQPNSVYFTDDFPSSFEKIGPYGSFGPHDIGVICLEDGSKRKHYTPDSAHKHLHPPIWISPIF